jgi:two-component system, NtrC family, sensor kinase
MSLVETSKRRLLTLAGAISVGLLIILILFFAFRRLEKQNAQAAFERFAQERFDRLEVNIALTLNDIRSLGAFFDVTQSVSRRDYARLTRPLLEENKAIQALEWVPKVPKNLRERYEDGARHDGLASFQFTERSASGRMAKAEERQDYYPVFFVEPLKGNEKALGFDLASDPVRNEALRRSAATGSFVATGRMRLVQESADQYGFLVFRPVYRGGVQPSSDKERRERLAGYALAVFRVGDIVERAGSVQNTASGLRVAIFDLDAKRGERLLYPKGAQFDGVGDLPTGSTTNSTNGSPAFPSSHFMQVCASQFCLPILANNAFVRRIGRKTTSS